MTTKQTDADMALEDFNGARGYRDGRIDVFGISAQTVETIRTALKQADKARGLVEALEWYEEKIRYRPYNPIIHEGAVDGHIAGTAYQDKGKRAREAIVAYQSEAEGI